MLVQILLGLGALYLLQRNQAMPGAGAAPGGSVGPPSPSTGAGGAPTGTANPLGGVVPGLSGGSVCPPGSEPFMTNVLGGGVSCSPVSNAGSQNGLGAGNGTGSNNSLPGSTPIPLNQLIPTQTPGVFAWVAPAGSPLGGLRLPASHRYERYNGDKGGSYTQVLAAQVPALVNAKVRIFDRTAKQWVFGQNVTSPVVNPMYRG